jgi:hypothetical protein
MAVNPFDQMNQGGGNMGGYGFGQMQPPPAAGGKQPYTGGTNQQITPTFGQPQSPVQNTTPAFVPPPQPVWYNQGYGNWRGNMAGMGGNQSPYTYQQPQNPWMQRGGYGQQGNMWGGGQNTNPMWAALMQQRFMPSQNPYAPPQPNPNMNYWLPGMNPYQNQAPPTQQIPQNTTGQGLSRNPNPYSPGIGMQTWNKQSGG